jgi:elongation factor Ts
MAVTAAEVKKLRDMTGAGMMECKKALTESDGDMDKAIELLRKRGIAKAEKKADRASTEGTVAIAVSDDRKKAVLLALSCETDFVGRNEDFIGIAHNMAVNALKNGLGTKEAVLDTAVEGKTGKDVVTEAVMKLGENIQLGDVAVAESENGFISTYIHMNGKIGVAVEMVGEYSEKADEAGKDVAMQVAAMKPVATRREGVPAELVEKEKEIYKDQIRQSGKPEELLERIAEGKMNKFFSEICLVEQAFVKDPKKKVLDYVKEVGKELGTDLDIKGFVRLNIGE